MENFIKEYKIALLVSIIALVLIFVTACNRPLIDIVYEYNYAYISLPSGECIEGDVQEWKDYSDGDQLQVKIDGTYYLTHASRVVLVKK